MFPIRAAWLPTFVVGLCATTLSGCGLTAPRSGELVESGVGRATFEARLRHTDVIQIPVVYPANEDGTADRSTAPRPAFVMLQGGGVSAERYFWLAERLAQRGFVVALPEHEVNLAIFHPDNGEAARQLLASSPAGSLLEGLVDPERIAVGGHSLGGVVATKLAVDGVFDALVIMASYPDPADVDALPNLAGPTLILAAEEDCQAKLDDVIANNEPVPEPKLLAVITGATHYQFTDSDQEDRDRDCAPSVELSAAHDRIANTTALFLEAALTNGTTASAPISAQEGVEIR